MGFDHEVEFKDSKPYGLEDLPVEILSRIVSKLPARSVDALAATNWIVHVRVRATAHERGYRRLNVAWRHLRKLSCPEKSPTSRPNETPTEVAAKRAAKDARIARQLISIRHTLAPLLRSVFYRFYVLRALIECGALPREAYLGYMAHRPTEQNAVGHLPSVDEIRRGLARAGQIDPVVAPFIHDYLPELQRMETTAEWYALNQPHIELVLADRNVVAFAVAIGHSKFLADLFRFVAVPAHIRALISSLAGLQCQIPGHHLRVANFLAFPQLTAMTEQGLVDDTDMIAAYVTGELFWERFVREVPALLVKAIIARSYGPQPADAPSLGMTKDGLEVRGQDSNTPTPFDFLNNVVVVHEPACLDGHTSGTNVRTHEATSLQRFYYVHYP
ncbi:hypothetical protein IWQ60_004171 [Tieghemiomyces parasiticus]|uniref:F-box domain-containing protein n=1 Tax=Tieghemiomyces parasiticus TaxID=78921 RepID=A0A9W8DZL0_9FUNG|nr:hypothetical protein IWQ60_004171 [Tieghemiomyces parasiticus]